MSPVERAAAVYHHEPCARTFREDLEAHLLRGVVWSTPEAFVMARRVSRDWPQDVIVDPWQGELTCAPDLCNCLHVYLAAGDLSRFFMLPHEGVEWVSFERSNKLRFHRLSRIKQLCTAPSKSTVPTSTPA